MDAPIPLSMGLVLIVRDANFQPASQHNRHKERNMMLAGKLQARARHHPPSCTTSQNALHAAV